MLKVSDISNDDYTDTATNQQQTLQNWMPKHVPVVLLARRMAVASIVVHMHIELVAVQKAKSNKRKTDQKLSRQCATERINNSYFTVNFYRFGHVSPRPVMIALSENIGFKAD